MHETKRYDGIDKDPKGAMNPTGNIIRDAWVFGIIPETETCAGWTVQAVDSPYDKISAAWEPCGHLASRLPEDAGRLAAINFQSLQASSSLFTVISCSPEQNSQVEGRVTRSENSLLETCS